MLGGRLLRLDRLGQFCPVASTFSSLHQPAVYNLNCRDRVAMATFVSQTCGTAQRQRLFSATSVQSHHQRSKLTRLPDALTHGPHLRFMSSRFLDLGKPKTKIAAPLVDAAPSVLQPYMKLMRWDRSACLYESTGCVSKAQNFTSKKSFKKQD